MGEEKDLITQNDNYNMTWRNDYLFIEEINM